MKNTVRFFNYPAYLRLIIASTILIFTTFIPASAAYYYSAYVPNLNPVHLAKSLASSQVASIGFSFILPYCNSFKLKKAIFKKEY